MTVQPYHILAVIQVMAGRLSAVANSVTTQEQIALVDELTKEIVALNAALQEQTAKAAA